MSPLSPLQQKKEATESGGPSRLKDGGGACSRDLRPHLDRKLEPQLQTKTELGSEWEPAGGQVARAQVPAAAEA